MATYYDVRFKYPWNCDGYGARDRVAFDGLVGYKHFFIGVNPDRTFNYLRIHDDDGGIKLDTELANISYAGLEALILWRLSTPIPVLNSMALACLGLRSPTDPVSVPAVYRQSVEDARFVADLSQVPLEEFKGQKICLMLVAQVGDRQCQSEPSRRELILYSRK